MPGTKWKRSLQNPRQYEAIRRENPGMSKQQAARISNAQTPGHKVKKSGKR